MNQLAQSGQFPSTQFLAAGADPVGAARSRFAMRFAPPASRACLVAGMAIALALLPRTGTSLTFKLPPDGEQIVGETVEILAQHEDTFADLARRYGLGYDELKAANPGVDPWLPGQSRRITLPTQFVLPDGPRAGIVINLAELRLYYFPPGEDVVETYPIGIGREGWSTPVADTRIAAKVENPSWTVPDSIREEHAKQGDPLPKVVPPGPDNPLGDHALRLRLPSYLIHGTNRPYGVGMRVSHGCIRLYPEDIAALFERTAVDTVVRIVNQPYKAGWRNGVLYAESHAPLAEETSEAGFNFTPMTNAVVQASASRVADIDWDQVLQVARAHSGIPIAVARSSAREQDSAQWLIQVGYFRDPDGVERLREQLMHMQLPVRVERAAQSDGQHVMAGPFYSEADASAARERLREQTGLDGILILVAPKASS